MWLCGSHDQLHAVTVTASRGEIGREREDGVVCRCWRSLLPPAQRRSRSSGGEWGGRETREAGESEVGRLPEVCGVRKEMCKLMWSLTCWTQRHINEKQP
jgi:hypothetical protein